ATRRSTRPLLQTGDARETLKRLLAERERFYREAHLHIDSQPGPHANTVDAIVTALRDHLRQGEQPQPATSASETHS
ncbi:MAG: shikimate kinase, partial [Hyphococcus sp.]